MPSTLAFPRQRHGSYRTPPSTPYLELDVPVAVERFLALTAALPGTAVHYAVKANPHPALLAVLAAAGCRFDVASPAEVRAALRAGAAPGDARLLQSREATRPRP